LAVLVLAAAIFAGTFWGAALVAAVFALLTSAVAFALVLLVL
jgi:hypothetical protein